MAVIRNWIYVFFGGMLGATIRFAVQEIFSTNTMLWIVNIVGSFLLGALNRYYEKNEKERNLKLFLTTGMLGAFTTFSTFSEHWFHQLQENVMIGLLFGFSMTFICYVVAFMGYRFLKRWT